MATPIENTLLALQLFQPIAQGSANYANRVIEARRLLQLQAFQREMEAERDARARDLARDQNERYMAIEKLRGDREDNREKERNRHQEAREDAAERRQKNTIEAADLKQLRAAIALEFPKYSRALSAIGEEPLSIADFPETWEGLAQLQAERTRADELKQQRDQGAAASVVADQLDEAEQRVAQAKTALDTLGKPSEEDMTFARTRAAQAVKQAIMNGDIAGVKADSPAAKKGLEALSKGDATIAAQLLGASAMTAYDAAFEASLQAAPNAKARMQQVNVAQQNYLQAQRELQTLSTKMLTAASSNFTLAQELKRRRTSKGVQTLMDAGETAPRGKKTFDELTPPRPSEQPAPGVAATPTIAPAAAPRALPNYFQMMGLGMPTNGAQAIVPQQTVVPVVQGPQEGDPDYDRGANNRAALLRGWRNIVGLIPEYAPGRNNSLFSYPDPTEGLPEDDTN